MSHFGSSEEKNSRSCVCVWAYLFFFHLREIFLSKHEIPRSKLMRMSSAGNVGKTDNIRNHLQLLSTKKFIDSFFSYSCFFVFVVVFALALQKKYTNREKIQLNDEDDAQNRRPYQSTHGGYRLQVVRFFLFGRKIQSHLRFHLTHV